MSDTPPKSKHAGMIQRRLEMPISIWNEVVGISKEGGLDYRDALIALLDMGLQAQSEDTLKPRIVSVDHKLWERVGRAKLKNATDSEALVYLLDLGLQVRAAQRVADKVEADEETPIPPDGIRVRVDLIGPRGKLQRIAEVYLPDVPARGDTVTVKGAHYSVEQRAWTFGDAQTCYLRVRAYGKR